MGEELIYVTLISSIFSLIGLITYFGLSTRKMKLESELNIRRFKIGKKYKIQEMQLPQKVDTRGVKDRAIDTVISKIANKYLGGEKEEETEEEINADGILNGALSYIEEHPEQGKKIGQLINKVLGGKGETEEQEKNIDNYR